MEVFTQSKFGGLNKSLSDFLIEDYEASRLENIDIGTEFVIRNRLGRKKYNSEPIGGASPVDVFGLCRYYQSSGNKFLLASAGDSLYKADENNKTWTSIKTGLSNSKFNFLTYKDKLYLTNGEEALKFDGTNVLNMGIEKPSAPTVAVGDAGNLTGDYQYKVAFEVDGYMIGEASVASATVSPSSQKVNLSDIPIGEADTTARILYRTEAGGSVFYRLARIGDNTTTTYTDNTPDADLGTDTEETLFGTPPKANIILLHKNFIFMAGDENYPSRLYFSKQDEPEIFPATYYWDISPNDGDRITGLASYLGNLYIFKENSIYPLYGNDTTDFQVARAPLARIGTVSHRSIVQTPQGLIFLHTTGVYRFNGSTVEQLPLSHKIKSEIDKLTSGSEKSLACAILKDNEYLLSFPKTGDSSNSVIWGYNLLTGQWSHHRDYGVNQFLLEEDNTLLSACNGGFVYEEDTGNKDDDADIQSVYATKFYDFGAPNIEKRFREFVIDVEQSDVTLEIQFNVDSGRQTYSKVIDDLYAGLVLWGEFTWGDGTKYNAVGRVVRRFSLPLKLRGKRIQITYLGKGQIKILSQAIKFIPTGRRI